MHLAPLLTMVPVFLSLSPKGVIERETNGWLPEGLGTALHIVFKHQFAEVTADTLCVVF